jgi:hypothetical protein
MACTPPLTRSPGSLVLHYQNLDNSTFHTIGWHFITGVDLNNVAVLQVEADRIAGFAKAVLTSRRAMASWSIRLPNGATFYSANLTTGAGPGTHATTGGMLNWYSTTLAFEGHGQAPSAGTCSGRIISRLHLGGAILFPIGGKYFDATADATVKAFVDSAMNLSTYLPADYYGQQGNITYQCPMQWNAHTQRKEGS